jgi:hypothetical protein
MTIYVSDFNPGGTNTEWLVVHDEGGHSGLISPDTVTYVPMAGGSPNHYYAGITCPVCGCPNTHPVGGGAQPSLVQELFVHLALRDGCPCDAPIAAAKQGPPPDDADVIAAHDHVKQHAEEMDGPGRWQVTPEQLRESLTP